jgi:hypothetical protein
MVIEKGNPLASTATASSTELSPASGAAVNGITSTGAVAASTSHTEAWIHGWYVDPIGLDLNGVVDYAVWNFNGSCVTSGSVGRNLGWDGGTGWYLESDPFSSSLNCTDVLSQSSGTEYQNNIFCAGQSTYTYYNPFWIKGLANGTATVRGVLSNAGLCGHILYPDITYGFGSPPGA